MSNVLSFPTPGRELQRCPTHSWSWHRRADGCGLCKSHRIAQQLIDNEPRECGRGLVTAQTADVPSLGSASMASLEEAANDCARALRLCAEIERGLFAAMMGGAS